MKKSTKLFAMMTVIALLVSITAAALADDKIYTSSVFSVPKERLKKEIQEELAQPEETPAYEEPDEAYEEPDATEEQEVPEEPLDPDAPVERQVKIYSSRKDVVIENDIIELTSELIGFGDVEVHYQWQVDRNDEKGWQDIEGATNWKHTFVATKQTILYNWRLIITVDDD